LLHLLIAGEGSTLVNDVTVTEVVFSDHCVVGFNVCKTNLVDAVYDQNFMNVIPQPVEMHDSSVIAHQSDPIHRVLPNVHEESVPQRNSSGSQSVPQRISSGSQSVPQRISSGSQSIHT